MEFQVGKIEVAVTQLDWAIKLFLDHKAFVPAITLAGAAEEILGQTLDRSAFEKLKESLSGKYGVAVRDLSQEHLNKAKNWLKHWMKMEDDEYINLELETEAIQYIVRAAANLHAYDQTVTSETPRFFRWLAEHRQDLISNV